MAGFKIAVITDEQQVLPGYVPLEKFGTDSLDHKRLSKAHNKGLIRAQKLMRTTDDMRSGKVWVHEHDAREYLDQLDGRKGLAVTEADSPEASPRFDSLSTSQGECAVRALCEINNGISLMLSTLERLTTAVESIATQPDYADRLRRDIVATCDNANGFHN